MISNGWQFDILSNLNSLRFVFEICFRASKPAKCGLSYSGGHGDLCCCHPSPFHFAPSALHVLKIEGPRLGDSYPQILRYQGTFTTLMNWLPFNSRSAFRTAARWLCRM